MRHVQLVGDHDDGDALVVELLKHAHDFDARAAVEIAGRLVGEQERGLIGERAGDGHTLLLTAGKLIGRVVSAFTEADGRQRLQGPLALAFAGQALAGVEHRQFDIFQSGRAREQIKALKNKPDFLIADVGQLVAIELRNVNVVEQVTALRWAVETADDVHQRGFSRTARAHERDEFTLKNFQRHAAHRLHLDFTGLVGLVNVRQFDDRLHANISTLTCRHHGNRRCRQMDLPRREAELRRRPVRT